MRTKLLLLSLALAGPLYAQDLGPVQSIAEADAGLPTVGAGCPLGFDGIYIQRDGTSRGRVLSCIAGTWTQIALSGCTGNEVQEGDGNCSLHTLNTTVITACLDNEVQEGRTDNDEGQPPTCVLTATLGGNPFVGATGSPTAWVPYSDGASGLTGESDFFYDDVTNTLHVDQITTIGQGKVDLADVASCDVPAEGRTVLCTKAGQLYIRDTAGGDILISNTDAETECVNAEDALFGDGTCQDVITEDEMDSGGELLTQVGAIIVGNSTTLPGTCTLGTLFVDTDADTDGSVFFCRATDTWKDIDDDGAGGGGDPILVNTVAVTDGNGIDITDGAEVSYTHATGPTPDTLTPVITPVADHIDAITEIATALKTGLDATLATGTAGATDDCAKWDGNGDLVSAGAACASSPTFDLVGDPAGAVTLVSGVTTETFQFSFESAFTTGTQFLLLQQTGNPTGGVFFEVRLADTDPVIARFGDGTNGVELTGGFVFSAIGTGTVVATSGDSATGFFSAGEIADAQVSDTLTASKHIGPGSTTDDVDLGTAEVVGVLDESKLDTNVCLDNAANTYSTGTQDFSSVGVVFAANEILFSELATEVRSINWNAGAMSVDGTHCAKSEKTPFASGPKQWTVVCAKDNAATIEGSTKMPDAWNGGTVTFELTILQTASATQDYEIDFAAKCISDDEAITAWGTPPTGEQPASITFTTANDENDDDTPNVTVDGTTCAGGDKLYWIGMLDVTATTSTAMTTAHITNVKMEYTTNIGD